VAIKVLDKVLFCRYISLYLAYFAKLHHSQEMLKKKDMSTQIKREVALMRIIQHPNIIAIKDVFATTTKIFIVLEVVEGGELFDKIVESGKFTEPQARFYMRQLIEGMECCHNAGICHRDLKPEVSWKGHYAPNYNLLFSELTVRC
jgi:5'-AMP-activated protein kinase catalytic alpha subunit